MLLSAGIDLQALQPQLRAWLAHKMPHATDLQVSEMLPAGAGFTSISILFTLTWREAGQPWSAGMVFRAPGTGEPVYPDPKLEKQFRILKCLQQTDVPVPKVYWLESDPNLLGFPFYVMSRIQGVIPSEYPPYHSFGACYDASPEARARMWWGLIEGMSRVHRLNWKDLGLSFLGVPPTGSASLEGELAYWEAYLEWAKEEPQPVLEEALTWLRNNRYALPRVALCWGDARLPNAVFSPEGDLLALLDWDMAILSDPESDLAFFLAMDWLLSEGTGVPRLPGFPGREETVARYEELTGWKVENFFYNEVFAVFRAGVVILKVQKNLQRMGIELPGEDPILDNFCTRRLADLLGLPAPAKARASSDRVAAARGTVQVHLTGPGGGDWYLVSECGRITRYTGRVDAADATVTVDANDWAAIRSGEMNPFIAWTTGKLKVSGNHSLYQQLADAITKTWNELEERS